MTKPMNWGYERADCRGNQALGLFLDDMENLLKHYAALEGSPEANLFQAQAAANKLLQAYDKNARGTQAFRNQSIQLRSIINNNHCLEFVPLFSSGLKEHLIALLKRSNESHLH
ncbi:MAG TPA: hypothetical protein VNT00_00315 [Eoetvoesiella sp.]|uniref:hypothetical protein n=1 Tax=Eoetvoesiella sp. TaxID=1966355 RepID=UPI002C4646BD|nr:hypothetical protein [Eoetvoesiella sp.]HWK59834.1 hypothetical protein [Eoetvoesiella sp.]